jgi:MFS family permease
MQLVPGGFARLSGSYRAVLDNGQLRRLELASLLWNTAEQVYVVGFLVFAYSVAGTGGVALAGLLQALPSVFLLPLALRLTSRVHHDRLLRGSIGLRTGAIALAAVAAGSPSTSWLVFVLAAVDAVAASVVRPTRAALVPQIARSPQELVAANVSITGGRSLASLIGPAIAALLLVNRDERLTLGAGAALFAMSLLTTFGVRVPGFRGASILLTPAPRGSVLTALRRLRHPPAIIAVIVAQQLVRGMLPVLLVTLVVSVLQAGDQLVGVLTSAIGLGGLIGGALSIAVLRRMRLALALAVALALWGIGILAPGIRPSFAVAAVFLAVGGIGKSIIEVTSVTLLQRTVPNADRSSVFVVLESGVALSVAVGAVVAAVLTNLLGVTTTMIVAGAAMIVLAIVSWPVLRSADDAAVVPDHELRLLRGVPMLRPLTLCTTEELAGHVRRVTVAPGEVLIQEGDVGDAFYILESGAMEAIVGQNGHGLVRELEPGDSFGEIALLRDVPRTATVRARSRSTVLALAREPFVAAVSGRHEAAAAAEEVIRGRIGM